MNDQRDADQGGLPDPPNLVQRVIELETQLAHAQHNFDQLNNVVTEQTMRQDRMQTEIRLLREKVEQLKQAKEPTPDLLDEKPPHY